MRVMEWEIKVSKLCNLRCSYCYEFEELGEQQRISLAGWQSILESARWYQEELQIRHPDEEITTRFVWHGGEPSLLPLSYYKDVLAVQRQVLGAENINTIYFNHIPTNIYAVSQETLAFWKQEKFRLAVSFDVISGVRVSTSGKATEARVEENIRNLLEDGWLLGCNTVLAAHNAPKLKQVYNHIRDLVLHTGGKLYMNIIPLHDTPTDDGKKSFSLPSPVIVDTLYELFEYWLTDEQAIGVFPLQEYYLDVIRKMLEMPRFYFDRRRYEESSLLVNTDGYVYTFNDAYNREKSLGCLFENTFSEIMQSPSYSHSLDRQDRAAERYCSTCPYDGYCNHQPLVTGHRQELGKHCSIRFPLYQKIEAALLAKGINSDLLKSPSFSQIPQLKFLVKSV